MEKHSRTIVKTIVWRMIATLVTIIVIYVFKRDVGDSVVIGVSANAIKMVLYYLHERIWNRISFGREIPKPPEYNI